MKKLVSLIVMLLISVTMLMAQDRTVSGVVLSSSDGEPIIGASVLVSGTTIGSATDIDGRFEIKNVPADRKELTISYIGFTTRVVKITNKSMTVMLESELEDLDEVVVVAYGTVKSKSLTSSIASVKGEALKDVPGSSVDGMLQGRAAGVMISTGSSNVGDAPVINIRGVASITSSTTPLYVVDGMPINTDNISSATAFNPIADINPADIKSIDILKDAAATAMYGSRAAAGVVLITTKNGQSSGKAKLTYDYAFNLNVPTEFTKTMNAEQYVEMKTLGRINSGYETADGDHMYNLMKDSKGNIINTNWTDLLFQTGNSHNHNLNVSGGNDKAQYYVGLGYQTQQGIAVHDDYERFSFKGNATIKANKWIKLGMNTSYTNSMVSHVDAGRGSGIYSINGFSRMALILPPNVPIYNEDGTPYVRAGHYVGSGANKFNVSYYNPATYLDEQFTETQNNRIIANGYLEYNPFKGLTLKSQFGIDWTFMFGTAFRSPNGGDGYSSGGSSSNYQNFQKIWTWTNTADYNFSIKKNHFDVLAGVEATDTQNRNMSRGATTLADPNMLFPEAAYLTYTGGGSRGESSMFSYITRFAYDYANRYYFTANWRRDGLSKLGTQWGNFWGLSGAWRISDEKFMKPAKSWLSDLKLKASYGVVGNASVGNYASRSLYGSAYYNGNASYRPNNYNDAKLGWEQTGTFDVGFSAALFGGRFNVDVDYFYSKSKDLILATPIAYSAGIYDASNGSAISTNLGKAMNKGLEIGLSGTVLQRGKFSWNSNFNISFVKNEVVELAEDILEDVAGYNITTEGKSMAQLYVYPTSGIDRETGRRIVDLNDGTQAALVYQGGAHYYRYVNGKITDEQVSSSLWTPIIAGGTKPTYYGGWTNTLKYGHWDATLFFQFSGGNKIYNGTKATASDQRFWNNSEDYYKKAWRKPGDKAVYAKPEYSDNTSNGSANAISDWVESGDYLRFKNILIGYTFDTKGIQKSLGISGIRVYAQATNLFCITSYTGMDPEVSSLAYKANTGSGIDKNTTPLTRTWTFGVNVSF